MIGCIRFSTTYEASWSTMDREASTKEQLHPALPGAEACGGEMVRGPKSGNGTRSPVYYLDSAGLVPPRPRAQALYGEMNSLGAGLLADGSLAADPGIGGSWQGAGSGGRWLLWPLRVVLWAPLLVIAFRGITAIVFNQASAPAGGGTGPRSATGGQFPASLAEADAAEFGRVYRASACKIKGCGSRPWQPSCWRRSWRPARTWAGTAPVSSTCRRSRSRALPCRIRGMPS